MSRAARQSKILELIALYEIETQEGLVDELIKQGFAVTQATVSRDIKELSLIKILTDKNSYKYSVINSENKIAAKHIGIFREVIVTCTEAASCLIIKTLPGSASLVASVIDQSGYEEAIGSIAGCDTVMVATKGENECAALKKKINQLLG